MLTPERGEASLNITLVNGVVTVFHGTDGVVLRQYHVSEGAWDEMFHAMIDALLIHQMEVTP